MDRALCIGIDKYPGTGRCLQGAVCDARAWSEALRKRGFVVSTLLDSAAGLADMRVAIEKLFAEAAPGDHLVLMFAGHGTCADPDANGDERSGFDQGLAPSDFHTAGPLLDDELHQLFNARPNGTTLLFIADCCHSGSVNRDPLAQLNEPPHENIRALPWNGIVTPRPAAGQRPPPPSAPSLPPARDDDILLAACGDGQQDVAKEMMVDGHMRGLLSYHAISALNELAATPANGPVDYLAWKLGLEGRFASEASQRPAWTSPDGALLRLALH